MKCLEAAGDQHPDLHASGRSRHRYQGAHVAPHHGIPEDPATGSANVALIGLLAKLWPEANLSLSKTIAQGVEMGRPSILHAKAEKEKGVVTATFIGGRCVPVMSGTIDLT